MVSNITVICYLLFAILLLIEIFGWQYYCFLFFLVGNIIVIYFFYLLLLIYLVLTEV